VRLLSKDEFLELYQVREALEIMAVRLAVPRLGGDDFAALQGLIDTMAKHAEHGEITEFFEANAAFHAYLFEASGNRKLKELYGQLLGQMGRYRMRSLTLRGNLHRSVAEHGAIPPRRETRQHGARCPSDVGAHPRAAAATEGADRRRACRRRSGSPSMSDRPLEFGINLNNREPLIAPELRHPDAARPLGDR